MTPAGSNVYSSDSCGGKALAQFLSRNKMEHTKTVTARKENESKKIATTVTITAVAIYKTLLINKIYEQCRLSPYPARM